MGGMFWLLFIAAAIVFVLSCTVFIVPPRINLLFELTSHFPYAYLIAGILVLVLGMIFGGGVSQKMMITILILCSFILNVSAIQPYISYGKQGVQDRRKNVAGKRFRVLTANVLSVNKKRTSLLRLIKQEKPDIIALQEVTPDLAKSLEVIKGAYPHSFVEPRDGTQGLAVYSKFPLSETHAVEMTRRRNLALVFDVEIEGQTVAAAVIHPPAPLSKEGFQDRNDVLVNTAGYVRAQNNRPVLIMGDFNITMYSRIYQAFAQTVGLKNSREAWGLAPTYSTTAIWPLPIPIDHILHSEDTVSLSARTGPRIGSDHFPLISDLVLREQTVKEDKNENAEDGKGEAAKEDSPMPETPSAPLFPEAP